LGVFIGFFLIVGLSLGIYGKATGTVISDMTYGIVVWVSLAAAIIISILKFRKK